jgi:hypothetical protein
VHYEAAEGAYAAVMLHGVFNGKFALSEDQLTSTVVGYLELLADGVFLGWLRNALPISEHAPLDFSESASLKTVLWPRTKGHGEPDMLVLIDDENKQHALIVEAKYGAGKSQWQSCLEHELGEKSSYYDQLARYDHALSTGDFLDVPIAAPRENHSVVYLTSDAAPPLDELRESLRHGPGCRLYWLSWHALAEQLQGVATSDATQIKVAASLSRLLGILGFGAFTGFGEKVTRPVEATSWSFYRAFFGLDATDTVDRELTWRFV